MSRKGLQSHAHKAHANGATEGWWYENPRSIDVYVRPLSGGDAVSCRIPRAQLEAALARMKKAAP